MNRFALFTAFAGLMASASSVCGLGINVGSLEKDFTHYGTADSREILSISTQYWSGDWTPVEVNFSRGDDTGEFYFASFSLNETNGVLSTLNCTDATLDFSSYAKVQGYLNAVNTNITATYLRIGSGALDMDGGSLVLTGTRSEFGDPGSGNNLTYQIYGEMNLKDVNFSAAGYVAASSAVDGSTGELLAGEIVLSGTTTFVGTELIIRDGCSMSVSDSASVDVHSLYAASLTVSESSKISVDTAEDISIGNLKLIMQGDNSLSFGEIFNSDDGDTIVFSAESTNISVYDADGNLYENVLFSYDGDGNITGIAAVPEPSAFAALAGALALGLAVCRRRL